MYFQYFYNMPLIHSDFANSILKIAAAYYLESEHKADPSKMVKSFPHFKEIKKLQQTDGYVRDLQYFDSCHGGDNNEEKSAVYVAEQLLHEIHWFTKDGRKYEIVTDDNINHEVTDNFHKKQEVELEPIEIFMRLIAIDRTWIKHLNDVKYKLKWPQPPSNHNMSHSNYMNSVCFSAIRGTLLVSDRVKHAHRQENYWDIGGKYI